MSLIEGLLPSTHITAEHAASRTLLVVSEVRLLREGIAELIEGNSGLLVASTCEKLTQIFTAGQGLDLLEIRGWDDAALGVIKV